MMSKILKGFWSSGYLKFLWVLLLTVFVTVGCGSGGGDSSSPSDTPHQEESPTYDATGVWDYVATVTQISENVNVTGGSLKGKEQGTCTFTQSGSSVTMTIDNGDGEPETFEGRAGGAIYTFTKQDKDDDGIDITLTIVFTLVSETSLSGTFVIKWPDGDTVTYTVTATKQVDGDNNPDGVTSWYKDSDNDGYGDSSSSIESDTQPSGYVLNKTDCDDDDGSVYPGATEVCGDNIDNDCDGGVDEGCSSMSSSKIPDTGQTTSYTDVFGEDSDYTINPQSYTKLDSNGNDLPDSATSWTMVRDNVTGLIWENKTDDGGIHDKDNIYTWQNAQDVFIAQINNSNFSGNSDWRMPTVKELATLRNLNKYFPLINDSYFPNTMSSIYWSSTTDAHSTDSAWCMFFDYGSVSYGAYKSNNYYVRAVRGGQSGAFDNSIISGRMMDNGDGTVTDTETGLMWQQGEPGLKTWTEALTYCETLSLAGYSDWRLPNTNDLQSIVDYQVYSPAGNTIAFPAIGAYYWSSTTLAFYTDYAWFVDFCDGGVGGNDKSLNYYVRAVRGGQ